MHPRKCSGSLWIAETAHYCRDENGFQALLMLFGLLRSLDDADIVVEGREDMPGCLAVSAIFENFCAVLEIELLIDKSTTDKPTAKSEFDINTMATSLDGVLSTLRSKLAKKLGHEIFGDKWTEAATIVADITKEIKSAENSITSCLEGVMAEHDYRQHTTLIATWIKLPTRVLKRKRMDKPVRRLQELYRLTVSRSPHELQELADSLKKDSTSGNGINKTMDCKHAVLVQFSPAYFGVLSRMDGKEYSLALFIFSYPIYVNTNFRI
ncbi:hypothetical protein E2P81_ATG06315 [Venturia nashicola]|nr:hypothetical protein E2P81_ATG06315 [Venturia nashicola]